MRLDAVEAAAGFERRGRRQQGFARALLSTVLTFLLVDLLQAFALLPRSGSTAILPMLHLFARETALSCLLLLPVYPALRAIRRIFPD